MLQEQLIEELKQIPNEKMAEIYDFACVMPLAEPWNASAALRCIQCSGLAKPRSP